jgi:hypothetical protein
MGKICKITNRLHGKSCALPTSKKICQVKKRVHLQQSGIISLAKSRSNLHQESWEKQVDFPNYWSCSLPAPVGLFFKLCKWVGKSYKKLYCIETITKACLLRCKITHTHTQITVIIDTSEQGYNSAISSDAICKITHTQITIIIDTSEQGYNAAISSWRDMQNHTHIDLARRSSILLHVVIEQAPFLLMA